MTKQGTTSKKVKVMKNTIEKIDEIQKEKLDQEDQKNESPIENGTGIVIVLSGDILIGGFLYRKQIAYKVNKEQFEALQHHSNILGIAIRLA